MVSILQEKKIEGQKSRSTVPAKKLPATNKTPDFSVAFKAMIRKFLYFFLNTILSSFMFFLQGLEKKFGKCEFKGIVQRKLRWVEIDRYQSTGIALGLGRWTFVFKFKGTPSWILQKSFCHHLSPIY
jgi:hypothetical protein